MKRILHTLVERPRPCSYLDHATASLEHRLMVGVSARELGALLARGWRRFGYDYFRPACAPCSECVPTRLPVAEFAPSKSQRRALRHARLDVVVGPPRIDDARLELHARWHREREQARGWHASHLDAESYHAQLAFEHEAAREITLWDGDTLVGVSLCDETDAAWSAVYFFHHPDYAAWSLGVVNVLVLVELARARGRDHLYLGYVVAGCPSLAYKQRYGPREVLVGWPRDDEEPRWVRALEPP